MNSRVLQIGVFRLDTAAGLLRDAAGAEVPIRPKSLALMEVLARNAGRTMSKEELLDAVWPGLCVTQDSLVQCVRDIRRALHDPEGRVLRAIAKRGYLLDLIVSAMPAAGSPDSPAMPIDAPSIAVLPFVNLETTLNTAILRKPSPLSCCQGSCESVGCWLLAAAPVSCSKTAAPI